MCEKMALHFAVLHGDGRPTFRATMERLRFVPVFILLFGSSSQIHHSPVARPSKAPPGAARGGRCPAGETRHDQGPSSGAFPRKTDRRGTDDELGPKDLDLPLPGSARRRCLTT